MLCLASVAGSFGRSMSCKLIAVAGFLAIVGCSPAGKDAAGDRAASKPASGSASVTADETAAGGSLTGSEDSNSTAKHKSATGPITVDDEGFVTLERTTVDEPNSDAAATASAQAKPEATPSAETERQVASVETTTQETAKPASTILNGAGEPVPTVASSSSSKGPLDSTAKEADAAKAEADQPAPSSDSVSYDEKHQEIAKGWPEPQALLVLTGQLHGYIEPCGCTGLENQKGGLNRRDTLLKQLEARGWNVVPMDVGNFERRGGRQAEIKFQTTVEALKDMGYRAATLGVDDLKLSSTHLLSLTATEGKTETPFISANTHILIEEYMPKQKIIEVGGRKIGVTAVLGDSFRPALSASTDIIMSPAAESLRPVVKQLQEAKCDYLVLLAHATLEESQQLAKDVPGFDLVVTAGGYPEPFYQLEEIEGSESKLAQVGAKGMYTVLVGLYPDSEEPVRYQRVALSSQFKDSPRMLTRFASYQKQLESLGFEGLGLRAATLPEGREFVGSEKCGDCHSKAYEVWKGSEHFTATESLVHPPNDRSMIPRHFDPECLSCHVTGWNAKSYFPYASGYKSLEETPLLTGSGCENCHGPGSKHVAAENGDIEADAALLAKLREQMRLPLSEAKTRCLDCHDQDNSPEFQHEGAFEKYWEQIAHPGKD